jgi:hypothetical protein
MRRSRLTPVLLLAACSLVVAACGGGGDGSSNDDAAPAQPAAAKAEEFPKAVGRTLPDIIGNLPSGPVLAPSVSLLEKGANRVGFALFDTAGKQLSGADVALYVGSTSGASPRGASR